MVNIQKLVSEREVRVISMREYALNGHCYIVRAERDPREGMLYDVAFKGIIVARGLKENEFTPRSA